MLKANKLFYFKSPKDTKPCKDSMMMENIVVQTKAECGSTDEAINEDWRVQTMPCYSALAFASFCA